MNISIWKMFFILWTSVSFLSFCGDGGKNHSWEVASKVHSGAKIVDVRTAHEFSKGHYPGAVNIPVEEIEDRIHSLESYKHRTVVLYCESGQRAGKAKKILEAKGFKTVYNAGGLEDMPAVK